MELLPIVVVEFAKFVLSAPICGVEDKITFQAWSEEIVLKFQT